jgi:hypothetical protein
MSTTFEEAKKCPKCDNVGKEVGSRPAKTGRGKRCTLHVIECVTELCRWYGERYVVQVNEDGSIPDAYSGALGSKQFPRISQESISRIEDNVRRQLEAEQTKGAEVNNPRGG